MYNLVKGILWGTADDQGGDDQKDDTKQIHRRRLNRNDIERGSADNVVNNNNANNNNVNTNNEEPDWIRDTVYGYLGDGAKTYHPFNVDDDDDDDIKNNSMSTNIVEDQGIPENERLARLADNKLMLEILRHYNEIVKVPCEPMKKFSIVQKIDLNPISADIGLMKFQQTNDTQFDAYAGAIKCKHFIKYLSPNIILISKEFWNKYFAPTLRNYSRNLKKEGRKRVSDFVPATTTTTTATKFHQTPESPQPIKLDEVGTLPSDKQIVDINIDSDVETISNGNITKFDIIE